MAINRINWICKEYNRELAEKISLELKVSLVLARLLTQRGISSVPEARAFLLAGREELVDPKEIHGMEKACQLIRQAIVDQKPIVVFGDYDVDGVCSTVILQECLESMGARVDHYIPDRLEEGYGLSLGAVEKLAGKGFGLLITVDSGINSIAEVDRARELGMEVVVTDHHTPGDCLPMAGAIVNPKLGAAAGLEELCGAGVAFKLGQALMSACGRGGESEKWLDLVALATVADIVPLLGENRILTRWGLKELSHSRRPGLRALIKESGLEGKPLKSWHIAFGLGPRLNAAGRLAHAEFGVRLLTCPDPAEAEQLARLLCNLNEERRALEESILEQAEKCIEEEKLAGQAALVVAGEAWHHGVTGIVASRLCEKYHRPVIIVSWEGESGRGSGRSTGSLNLYEALQQTSQYLSRFGGHRLAAGLSLERRDFFTFREEFCQWVEQHTTADEAGAVREIDLELVRDDINWSLIEEIAMLEPCGEGNPAPRFLVHAAEVDHPLLVGKEKGHFKARVSGLDGIAFNRAEMLHFPFEYRYDVLCQLDANEYRGQKQVQVRIDELTPCHERDYFTRQVLTGELHQLLVAVGEQLSRKQPVVLLFSTWRLLTRYLPLFSSNFKQDLVEVLHGVKSRHQREQGMAALVRGTPRLYLVTQPFWEYFLATESSVPGSSGEINGTEKELSAALQRLEQPLAAGKRAGKEKTYIYVNRSSTLQKLKGLPGIYIEAGLDLERRQALRHDFLAGQGRYLLSDGIYGGGWPEGVFGRLVFADAPYSLAEAGWVRAQLPEPVPALAAFGENDLRFNQRFLDLAYPEAERLEEVWKIVSTLGKGPLCKTTGEWNRLLGGEKPGGSAIESQAIFQILDDLGLCQYDRKGSIIEIKVIDPSKRVPSVGLSPLYHEGLAEKVAFAKWKKELVESEIW